ncbi:MAG: hypothetical protein GC160_05935 [Acidobacteria bacterium]|nr:hypothetical protein [Acidobacteriota bacterium]
MLFRRLIAKAARELANDPEARAKAKQVYEDEVKPRAQKLYKEHETEIHSAKDSAIRGAARLAVNLKKKLQEK